jgi:hypothetical protein
MVIVVGLHDDGPDDVVEARAQPAAGDDGRLDLGGIEINALPGPGHLEIGEAGAGPALEFTGVEFHPHPLGIGVEPAVRQGRRDLGRAKHRDIGIDRGFGALFGHGRLLWFLRR